MVKKLFFCVWFIAISFYKGLAQDTPVMQEHYTAMDSLQLGILPAKVETRARDSVTPKLLMPQDSLLQLHILDSLANGYRLEMVYPKAHLYKNSSLPAGVTLETGRAIKHKDGWLLIIIGGLLVTFAVIKNTFSSELIPIITSFYSKRALISLNKEESVTASWPFLFSLVFFSLTLGLFLYLATSHLNTFKVNGQLETLLLYAVFMMVLYLFKVWSLRLLGFIFEITKPLATYVSILHLSYFNISFFFVPLVVAFCLSPNKYADFYISVGFGLFVILTLIQFIRASLNILSQHNFSKVYLFIYLCTLEISPILILIKAMGYKL